MYHLDRNEPARHKQGGTQLAVTPSRGPFAEPQNKLVSESELLMAYLWEENVKRRVHPEPLDTDIQVKSVLQVLNDGGRKIIHSRCKDILWKMLWRVA